MLKFAEHCMQNVKQIIHEIADQLPEEATLEDVMYTLYVRQKLERARQAVSEGFQDAPAISTRNFGRNG